MKKVIETGEFYDFLIFFKKRYTIPNFSGIMSSVLREYKEEGKKPKI